MHRKFARICKAGLGMLIILQLPSGCKSNTPDIKADFSYSYTDDNHIEIVNASEGDYYSASWNFGNGETDVTTDKKKTYNIYYPDAGSYKVSLKILDYVGNTDTTSQSVSITKSDLVVAFTAEVQEDRPNYVLLTNTTTGSYDSLTWHYRDMEVDGKMSFEAYFPKKGTYTIELEVMKDGKSYSAENTVTIAADDPEYIEGMTLVWSDEFDGTSVNTADWTFETGATGWGNNELQNYTNGANAVVSGGYLAIIAKKVDDNKTVGSYTSSRIVTRGRKEFKYGRLEIRAQLPSGTGIWPAIWMLGSNFSTAGWPACGEMDIMEYVGYVPDVVYSTVHTPAGYGGSGDGSSKSLPSCEEEFHIYGLIWNEEELIFYTDTPSNVTHRYAPAVKTADNWPFDKEAFFILNVAVGGNWGGAAGIDNSIFPQQMVIDYVRVYQETIN